MPLNFFGKKKQAPTPKESIAKLRETVEMLEKREQFLQKKCEQQVAQAKQFMQQKNKKGSKLKKKNLLNLKLL
jgi:charged multivesicular body protein 4